MPNLVGVKLKLGRANHHLQELNTEITRFLKESSHTAVADFNPALGHYDVHIHLIPIPDNWSLVIGDVVHNIRAALDHLVCDLALLGPTPDCSETEFPIFLSRKLYVSSRDRLKPLRQDRRAFIEGQNPYDRPDDPLWLLHRMDSTDKHRHILLIRGVTYFTGIQGYVADPSTMLAVDSADLQGQPIEDGTVIGWFRAVPPDAEVNVSFQIAFTILFRTGTPDIEGRDVLRTLSDVYQHVSTLVSECEKRFFS
ncbi:MAG: hypothetical protein HYU30_05860 [Chloroflexi bacterium]|nr:hypothetical protein [Chloroflexota bacterium]